MNSLILSAFWVCTQATAAVDVDYVCAVAPDVVSVTLSDGAIQYGRQMPYEAADGDVIEEQGIRDWWLKRGGQFVGGIVGADRNILAPFDTLVKPEFDAAHASEAGRYALTSSGDARYATRRSPIAVHRKTKPRDMGRVGPGSFDAALIHMSICICRSP